jgi:gas vesicle protein
MKNKDCMIGILIGLGCGSGIAILLAPTSGDEMRSRIANNARGRTDDLKNQVAGLRDAATELPEKSRKKVERYKESLQHAVRAGKQAYRESVA